MLSFMNQSALATTVLDFTSDLSLLLVGLLAVVWLSTAIIIWMALSPFLIQRTRSVGEPAATAVERKDVA